jgi:hypothetical protein
MKRVTRAGILPRVLVDQVRSTAGWLWADPAAEELTRVLDDVDGAEADRETAGVAYSRLLFAAHYATVATFVPTDVDARIRHHAWMALEREEELAATCDALDAIAKGDVHRVSARVVDSTHGTLSGHDGEWLSVRAGALGRALALGFEALAKRLEDTIAAELAREEAIFVEASKGAPARALATATTIAHNLGDLSRVVEQWPNRPEHAALRARFARLGHEESSNRTFAIAGIINKAVTANENHRFLALRKPRALRTARALLLPIGPWFDAWGETVAKMLDDRDRAEVVTALLELHLAQPAQLGCLRALAGIHRATRGGLEVHVPDLPARIRKEALRGKVREAIDLPPERFEARMANRWEAERARLR